MKRVFYFLLTIIIYTAGCEKPPFAESRKSFWVKNISASTIVVLRSYQYPDTTIPDKENELGRIPPGIDAPYDYTKKQWKELFEQHPNDTTMSVFIFSADTLAKYSWQEIRSGYKILKRYDLSGEDLKNMNYTIIYP